MRSALSSSSMRVTSAENFAISTPEKYLNWKEKEQTLLQYNPAPMNNNTGSTNFHLTLSIKSFYCEKKSSLNILPFLHVTQFFFLLLMFSFNRFLVHKKKLYVKLRSSSTLRREREMLAATEMCFWKHFHEKIFFKVYFCT